MLPITTIALNSQPSIGHKPRESTVSSKALVLIVEDDLSVQQAIASLVRSVGWEAETYGSADDFLRRVRREVPSCLVLDVRLPGLSGLDLQGRIAALGETIPILFITGHGDIPMSVRAMKAGAVEFLTKPFAEQELLDGIGRALERDQATRTREAELRELRECYASLTPRERQVLTLVVAGRLNKQVAAELGISEITAKVHRARAMEKMRARSLAELVSRTAKVAYTNV
jgi:RNA polymerase sigma factor (sigma-70 family)